MKLPGSRREIRRAGRILRVLERVMFELAVRPTARCQRLEEMCKIMWLRACQNRGFYREMARTFGEYDSTPHRNPTNVLHPMNSRIHRLPLFTVGLTLPLLISTSLKAAVLVYEGFEYDTGTLTAGEDGGFGWNDGWYNNATSQSVTGNRGAIASGSLATPAGMIASGNHLESGAVSARGERLLDSALFIDTQVDGVIFSA